MQAQWVVMVGAGTVGLSDFCTSTEQMFKVLVSIHNCKDAAVNWKLTRSWRGSKQKEPCFARRGTDGMYPYSTRIVVMFLLFLVAFEVVCSPPTPSPEYRHIRETSVGE
jgi:hypothetical protein